MREAIAIATEAGQGLAATVIYCNLGEALWEHEGAAAALELTRSGIAFAQARGLSDEVNYLTASMLDPLVSSGELDQALELAATITERLESAGMLALVMARAVQVRVLTLRGQAAQAAASLDWLEPACRETGDLQTVVIGLPAAALTHAALGQYDRAVALLTEIDVTPGTRDIHYYAPYLPAMVNTALAIGDRQLAERLAIGVEPVHPYAEHALVTVAAAVAEARGDHLAAADGYAQAAGRWQQFGVVPEQAFALLGQGRCLNALGCPAEATQALQQARGIFQALQAAPALAETDALLRQTGALSA